MNLLRQIANSVILFILLVSAAQATTIQYVSTYINGTQWRYDYTVHNDTLAVPIEEFSIFFDAGLYSNLLNVSNIPDWDILVIAPDPAIPASGFLDALALTSGIPLCRDEKWFFNHVRLLWC